MSLDLSGINLIIIVHIAAAFVLQLLLLRFTKCLVLRLIPLYIMAAALVIAGLFAFHIVVEESGGFIDAGGLVGALVFVMVLLWAGGAAAAWLVWLLRYLIRRYRDPGR